MLFDYLELELGLCQALLIQLHFYCSANRGDSLDREIDNESRQTDDLIILVCSAFNAFSLTTYNCI